jgi:hypothetical protein
VSSLVDVLKTLKSNVSTAINAAGVTTPGKTVRGWPVTTQLADILAKKGYLVTVYPQEGSTDESRYREERIAESLPTVSLVATVANDVVTFSGAVAAELNVHVFVGKPLREVLYQTVQGDTLASIATALATAINALALSGVHATPNGATLQVTGSPALRCNVGGSGTITLEVGRDARDIQVSVWAPNEATRDAVGTAIIAAIGTVRNHDLTLPDGTMAPIHKVGDRLRDKAQSPYSCYEWHIIFHVEYPRCEVQPATQIGAIKAVSVVNAQAPVTAYSGGS